MGKLIWHDLSRYISLTASVCRWHILVCHNYLHHLFKPDAVWAGLWGIFFRKFFWDFLGGILRNPGGLQ